MPSTLPPCPQAASGGGVLPAPLNPLVMAIEQTAPVPERAPPPPLLDTDFSDDPAARWPFHLPAWNAIDALYWSMLARAVYAEDDTWILRVARWSGTVLRSQYVPPLAPPVVGRALIEFSDHWLCVVAGTNSDPERNAYLLGHALEQLSVDDVKFWACNAQWYTRSTTVFNAAIAWPYSTAKPVICIGHSSGGAEGSVTAVRFGDRSEASTQHAVTFGCPRWCSSSLLDHITLEKRPQVIEFALPGDPVPLVPPPWSVIDALRLNYNIAARPSYLRPGALLEMQGANGVSPRTSTSNADLYEAARQVLAANLSTTNHATSAYTSSAATWAQSYCAGNNSSEVIAGLLTILAEMDAAEV